MRVEVEAKDLIECSTEGLVLGIFEGHKPEGQIKELDEKLNNEISSLMQKKEFNGETGQHALISTLGRIKAKKIILVGLGKKEEFYSETLRRASALASIVARNNSLKDFSFALHSIQAKIPEEETASSITEGVLLSLYQFTEFKTQELDKIKKIEKFVVLCDKKDFNKVSSAVNESHTVCHAVNYARSLVNRPSNLKAPEELARELSAQAKKLKVKCKVLKEKELKQKGMNAFLSVAKGSTQKPVLVVLDYNSNARDSIALIGKGITFDSGGLNLKPEDYMTDMKDDMSGAAIVFAVIQAASHLRLPIRILGFLPLTENMPGPNASKPGDIVKAFNGKTIEILNTDAEGRLILADAIAFAETFKPKALIDIATLTGSARVALGRYFTAVLGNNDELINKLIASGERTGERLWMLPLIQEYKDFMKSDLADVKNISSYRGEAGTILGAAFLSYFVEKTDWMHLDIGATAFASEPDKAKTYISKGATATGVRALIDFLKDFSAK